MSRVKGSGLSDEQAKRLAVELKKYLREYDDNATRMAKAWGISQSQLSQLLSARSRGAGVAVLCRIRQATRRTLDDLLGLPELHAPAAPPSPPPPSEPPRRLSSLAEQRLLESVERAMAELTAAEREAAERPLPQLPPTPRRLAPPKKRTHE